LSEARVVNRGSRQPPKSTLSSSPGPRQLTCCRLLLLLVFLLLVPVGGFLRGLLPGDFPRHFLLGGAGGQPQQEESQQQDYDYEQSPRSARPQSFCSLFRLLPKSLLMLQGMLALSGLPVQRHLASRSPSCREEIFSEAELPALSLLGILRGGSSEGIMRD
jgi:hypothetical protein